MFRVTFNHRKNKQCKTLEKLNVINGLIYLIEELETRQINQ